MTDTRRVAEAATSEQYLKALDRIAALEAENVELRADNTNFIVAWKAHLEAAGCSAEIAERMVNETAAKLIAARAALKETP